MDQIALVNEQIDDGRRFIERFVADGNPARSGAWIKMTDDEHWYLYLATDNFRQIGSKQAYDAMLVSLRKLTDPWMSSFDIKLIDASDPMAQDIVRITANRSPRVSTHYNGSVLGNQSIDAAYIYPKYLFDRAGVARMTAEEVMREVFRLMNRGPGPLAPSRVVLNDGSSFDGVPFSIDLGTQRIPEIKFVVGNEPPRIVPAAEIASIN